MKPKRIHHNAQDRSRPVPLFVPLAWVRERVDIQRGIPRSTRENHTPLHQHCQQNEEADDAPHSELSPVRSCKNGRGGPARSRQGNNRRKKAATLCTLIIDHCRRRWIDGGTRQSYHGVHDCCVGLLDLLRQAGRPVTCCRPTIRAWAAVWIPFTDLRRKGKLCGSTARRCGWQTCCLPY